MCEHINDIEANSFMDENQGNARLLNQACGFVEESCQFMKFILVEDVRNYRLKTINAELRLQRRITAVSVGVARWCILHTNQVSIPITADSIVVLRITFRQLKFKVDVTQTFM